MSGIGMCAVIGCPVLEWSLYLDAHCIQVVYLFFMSVSQDMTSEYHIL
jgi:hypothetical protein